jgi:hypothetical protein
MADIQSLAEELKRLRDEQDRETALAVFVGMTKETARQHDERQIRIYKMMDEIAALTKGPTV